MNEDDLLKAADAKLAQNEIELLGCYDVHPEPYENNPEAAEARRAFLDHLLAPFFARIRELEGALRPLALMADRYDPDDGDGDLECWSGLAVPKIKHLRIARAALKGTPHE